MADRNKPETLPILVKASIISDHDDYNLVHDVFSFVNALMSKGKYRPDELPVHAIQFYNVFIYDGEISNGGHSQYIHNGMVRTGSDDMRVSFRSTYDGLIAMGAARQADILRRLMAWVDANPQIADEQTGFEGGRAEELDTLDDELNAANEAGSIFQRAAAWIKGWSDLKLVGDAEFENACTALIIANPNRRQLISRERIPALHGFASDPVLIAIVLALLSVNKTEVMLEFPYEFELAQDGKADVIYLAETNVGERYAIAENDGVAVYACRRVPDYGEAVKKKDIGPVVARVKSKDVDDFIEEIDKLPIAAATDLLLYQARPLCDEATLVVRGPGYDVSSKSQLPPPAAVNPSFHVIVDEDVFVLTQNQDGFTLAAVNGQESYGPVSFTEAERHAMDVKR